MAHILVIDDDPAIRELLRWALESVRHQVDEAADGRAGIAAYRRVAADLVITDVLMPELSGLDTIIELTREFLDVKVIAITGDQERPRLLDHAKPLGARRTLTKPFGIDELLSAVSYELTH